MDNYPGSLGSLLPEQAATGMENRGATAAPDPFAPEIPLAQQALQDPQAPQGPPASPMDMGGYRQSMGYNNPSIPPFQQIPQPAAMPAQAQYGQLGGRFGDQDPLGRTGGTLNPQQAALLAAVSNRGISNGKGYR